MTLQTISVSCSKEININELRIMVQNTIASGTLFLSISPYLVTYIYQIAPVLGTKLPFSYFFFESLLKEFAQSGGQETPVMTQSELLRIGGVCGLNTLEEVIDATRVLHEAGSIVYFDKVTALKDLVILNPQWLFEVLATVFTTKHTWAKKGIIDSIGLSQVRIQLFLML